MRGRRYAFAQIGARCLIYGPRERERKRKRKERGTEREERKRKRKRKGKRKEKIKTKRERERARERERTPRPGRSRPGRPAGAPRPAGEEACPERRKAQPAPNATPKARPTLRPTPALGPLVPPTGADLVDQIRPHRCRQALARHGSGPGALPPPDAAEQGGSQGERGCGE